MKISVSIMAHPKRKAEAEALHKILVQYPFSSVHIIWDEMNNEWHTGERALRCGELLGSDWHLVVQDDAIISPDFYINIEKVIATVPTNVVISLYTGTVRPLTDRVSQAVAQAPLGSFLEHYMMLWGVGILLPSFHIQPLLEFIDDPKYSDTPYDQRIGIFYQRNRLPIYYTNPSLVDHDNSIGSLIGNDLTVEPRVAHKLAHGIVDWTSTVTPI